jgi:pimeloyl-ACP methyl ester carboxylesterase
MKRRRLLRFVGIGLILVLLAVLVVPLVIPIPPIPAAATPQELADPDSRFLEIGDLTVHYKRMGEGEPALLLLHGFLASTQSWRRIMPALAQDTTVIAFDRPAFGLTERPLPGSFPQARNPYTTAAQIELILGLLDQLGINKAVLVGHSAGGPLAARVALAYPERVEALILIAPAIYTGGGTPAWLKPLLGTPQARRLGPYLVRRFLTGSLDRLVSLAWHDPARFTAADAEAYTRYTRIPDWDRALWEFTLAGGSAFPIERLAELDLPVLVITGDDDRLVPTADSIRLAETLPQATLVVIPACGHVPQEECPEATLAAMADFLTTSIQKR